MKRIIILIIELVAVISIDAADVVVDGISYDVDLSKMEAKVVRGEYAYRNINIPDKIYYNGRSFTVNSIGKDAFTVKWGFDNEAGLVLSVTIPHSIKTIEEEAFKNNKYIRKLFLPNSIEHIGPFNIFSVTDSIIIEDSEHSIDFQYQKNWRMGIFDCKYLYVGRDIKAEELGLDYGFSGLVGCHTIETIEFGDNVTKPLKLSYSYSSSDHLSLNNLKTMIIGKNITEMFWLSYTPSLTTLISRSENPVGFSETNEFLTNQQYMNIELYVPKGTKERYLMTSGWRNFFKIIEAEVYPVQVIANSYSRIYGEENPYFEYTYNGATLDGHPILSCSATELSPVGNYPITIDKGTIKNICVNYVDGKLSIQKAPLSISVGTYTKAQGEPNPDFVVDFEGFQNGETKDYLKRQPDIICMASRNSKPGEYPIIVRDAEADNYDISYTNGILIIEEPNNIITVNADTKDNDYYTLMGTKLESRPTKGIYIKSGHKVLVP